MTFRGNMTSGSVEVRDWEPEDIGPIWDIMQTWPQWYPGKDRARTSREFRSWWESTIKACMVAVDSEEGLIGCVYLSPIIRGQYATPHIVKRKGYGNPALVRAIIRKPGLIRRWYVDHDLHRLWCWTASRAAVQLAILLGFRVEGVARGYLPTDSGRMDAWQLSLLRNEAWKKTPIGNALRLLRWKLTP